MIYDIWHYIFSFLNPETQRKIRPTCKLFDNIYEDYNHIRKNINSKKHGFYQYAGNKQVKVYKFESVEIKKKYERIVFKVNGKRVLRKILYGRNKTPYCRDPYNRKNEFVYKCDLGKIHDLFKVYCDKCWNLTECEYEYCYSECGVFKCNNKKIHFHEICQKCFKVNFKNLNEALQFRQKKMFKKTDVVFM
jgi:hypothetical protein